MKKIIFLMLSVLAMVIGFIPVNAEEYKVADVSNSYFVCGDEATVVIVEVPSDEFFQPVICLSAKELTQVKKFFRVKNIKNAKGMTFSDGGIYDNPVIKRIVRDIKQGKEVFSKIKK